MDKPDSSWWSGLRFSRLEFSGSLGDLGTFLPLVLAMVLASQLDLGMILICAGVMNILTGVLFHQPIPVQPMKAIAAVAITEKLLAGELTAAGLMMGALMVLLAVSGTISTIDRLVPRAVVRGIQLGVGLKLAARGVTWIGDLPLWGADSIALALCTVLIMLYLWARQKPAVLVMFLAGFLVLLLTRPEAFDGVRIALPHFQIHWPAATHWFPALLNAVIPQAPLTILNSVVAVCALSADYFPAQGISPKKMAVSVGIMNLLCVPLGGIPMCHGSGGLAAQYLFGARTGGSVVMLGLLKVGGGLLFGEALISLLHHYPVGILGPLLILAGIELARAARDAVDSQKWVICLATAAFILGINTAAGFLVGVSVALLLKLWQWGQGRWWPRSLSA